LTPTGVAQATEILTTPCARNFKKPTLIITSPSRRCLETTLYAFHHKFNQKLNNAITFGMEFPHSNHSLCRLKKMFGSGIVKFLADPRITEVGLCKDDVGINKPLPMEEQLEMFREIFTFPPELFLPGHDQDWITRKGFYDGMVGNEECMKRCFSFMKFILERPEEEIIVVAHQGFLVNYLLDPFEIQSIDNAKGITIDFNWRKGYKMPKASLRKGRGEKGGKDAEALSIWEKLRKMFNSKVTRNDRKGEVSCNGNG
jgi:broad specificity phosphatase PhoE